MMALLVFSCSTDTKNPEKCTDEEVNQWYEKQEWLAGWDVSPDESVNKRSLALHYHKNPKHWDQAFAFLKEADLLNLPVGKQELEGEHLFIAVNEYDSKELSDTKYESHRKYIDIQYVISGEEKMGVTTLDKAKLEGSYDAEKDLAFYTSEQGEYYKATSANFFVFFPEDVHRPSVKVDNSVPVKKVVVKILID